PELDVTVGRGEVDVDDEVVPDPAHQRSGPERRVSVVVDLERRALDVEFERRRAAATGVMPLREDLPGVRRRKIGGEQGAPRVPPVVAFDVVVTLHRNFVARSAEGDVALVQLDPQRVLALARRRLHDGEAARNAFVAVPLRDVARLVIASPENCRQERKHEHEQPPGWLLSGTAGARRSGCPTKEAGEDFPARCAAACGPARLSYFSARLTTRSSEGRTPPEQATAR